MENKILVPVYDIEEVEGALRVWWIVNPPSAPFHYPVDNADEAIEIIEKLTKIDLADSRIWANAGGLEVFEDGEWSEWYDEYGDDIMEVINRKERDG